MIQQDSSVQSEAPPAQTHLQINDHSQVIDVGENILVLTGWTPRDLTGHLITELLHPSDVPQIESLLNQAPTAAPSSPAAVVRIQHASLGWTRVAITLESNPDRTSDARMLMLTESQGHLTSAPPIARLPEDILAIVETLFEPQDLCAIFGNHHEFLWGSQTLQDTLGALPQSTGNWSETDFFTHYALEWKSEPLSLQSVPGDGYTQLRQGPMMASAQGENLHFHCQRKIWAPPSSEKPYVIVLLHPIPDFNPRPNATAEIGFSAIRSAAHEFRNIFSVIGGHIALLTAGPDQTDHHSQAQLTQYTQQAIELVESLSLIGHLDDHQTVTFSPSAHIKELESVLQLFMGKRLTINCQEHIESFECHGLAAHFDQVVLQSIKDCQCFLPDSGRVTIEVRANDGYLSLLFLLFNVDVHARSSDIEVLQGGHAWEALVREHFESLQTLAEEYDTKLAFTSSGQTLSLGLSLPGQQLLKTTVSRVRATTRAIKQALLIEDDPGVSDLVALFLGALGMDVTTCASEQDVLALTDYDFDMIVSDVMLTGSKTGPDLVRSIRQEYPDIPCLFISGYKHGALTSADLEQPKTDFLAKPFSKQDFTDRVGALMGVS